MLSFFPLDVLDENWDLIESVSEGFLILPTLETTVVTPFQCIPLTLTLVPCHNHISLILIMAAILYGSLHYDHYDQDAFLAAA